MSPLAAKLLRLILGLYFSVAIVATGFQLFSEYVDERESMLAEVSESVELMMPALATGLLDRDEQLIGEILRALFKNQAITGLHLAGDIEVVEGLVDGVSQSTAPKSIRWVDSSFKQSFAIEHVAGNGGQTIVGYLYTFSQKAVLMARVENVFISVLLSALVKTACLWIILYFAIKSMVAVPLVKLSSHVDEINRDLGAEKLIASNQETDSGQVDELSLLFRTILTMRRALKKSRAALAAQHEQLLVKASEAEAANIAKSEFLANISHELRTPMHAILSFSAIGERKLAKTGATEGRGYFEKISASGNRLMMLLNDLLDLAKLESRKMEIEFHEESANKLAQMAVDEMESFAKLQDIQLQLKTTDDDDRCLIDIPRCMQVMRNLLSNAIKFSPGKSRIIVGVTRNQNQQFDSDHLYIYVEDQGIGIPEEEVELVFDKFVQSSVTKTEVGGTGLGLAISREIVEQLDGEIWVEANAEGGSRFVVKFPLAEVISQAA